MKDTFISKNGITFYVGTDEKVVKVLEKAIQTGEKLRIWYGDKVTGRDWMEIWDVYGRIGVSYGNVHIPLLIKTSRSTGGTPVLTDCIVKITLDKKTIYQHKSFNQPKFIIRDASYELQKKGYMFSVYAGDTNIYNCKERKQAENEIAFHKGLRNKAA